MLTVASTQSIMKALRSESNKAKAYYSLAPYPFYGFQEWKVEERGSIPKCRPYVKHITDQQARFLFGKNVHFDVSDDDTATEWCNKVWRTSRMASNALSMARKGGQSGSVVLTWSFNAESRSPWQINIMDPFEEAIVTMDPTDIWRVQGLRLFKPLIIDNKPMVQVIDWTDETETIYAPVSLSILETSHGSIADQFDSYLAENGKLKLVKTQKNPFGIVPAWIIQNRIEDGTYGTGDVWGLWNHIDQLNLTADLAYKHNQTEVYPKTVYLDVDWSNNEASKPHAPGDDIVVDSNDPARQGKVETLTSPTNVREVLAKDLDEFVATLYEAAGGVQIRPDLVSNKGNMTGAVLEQLYGPLIETTEEKRRCYGDNGVCEFLRRLMVGASNMKALDFDPVDEVEIIWPNMLRLAEDELTQMVNREILMVQRGFTTQDRAVRSVAAANGVQDVRGLVNKLAKEGAPTAHEVETTNDDDENTDGDTETAE